ncbi:MAG TPA: MBL fold metallo-hydrolase [Burkholderiales bacterium]|nr:MBL fold metallo-hydrolase [Burkholderiales bacterium]
MRFASLGSGSSGNALVVEVKQTRVLLDCGFPLKEAVTRLARLGLEPRQLSGIIVTHEHDDHARGVGALARRFGLPVWSTWGTSVALGAACASLKHIQLMQGGYKFSVGDIEVQPYTVPHDAREPVQCVFGDGDVRLGVLTDVGCATPHIESVLTGCHALVLECNHDADMLENGPYPPALKCRIAGRFGHMKNEAAGELLARLDCRLLQHVIAAHLSRYNNTPQLAGIALARAINCGAEWIGVADQDSGFDWREISHR